MCMRGKPLESLCALQMNTKAELTLRYWIIPVQACCKWKVDVNWILKTVTGSIVRFSTSPVPSLTHKLFLHLIVHAVNVFRDTEREDAGLRGWHYEDEEQWRGKRREKKRLRGEEWEPWPGVWHSAHALSACGHWDVKLSQRLFLFLFLLPCSWLFSHACSLPLSAERSLVEIVLSICVQCALQVFNITPFTQSDEAMQSCSPFLFKAAHLHSYCTIYLFIHIVINDRVGPQINGILL